MFPEVIHRRQHLPITSAQAWEFFSNPENLCRITPAWLCFSVRSGAESTMYAGQILTYRIRPFPGIVLGWVTEITHVRHGAFFVDEQRMGPYRFWHHQHHFRPSRGGVLMEDIVHYALPLGPVGKLMNRLCVRGRLRSIFDYRHDVLEELFVRQGGPTG